MTTGRINQVTILNAEVGPGRPPNQPDPPKRTEVVRPEGPGPKSPADPQVSRTVK